jgi:hypothetical protein
MLVHAHVPAPFDKDTEYIYKKPNEIILLFNKAVKNGELYVFDTKISLEMITPQNVQYVYELKNLKPLIKIYSLINRPIPVPYHDGCMVNGVTATMTIDGRIIESAAHVQIPE